MEENNGSSKAWDWTGDYDRWDSWQKQMDKVETVEKTRLQAQRKRDKMQGLQHLTCCSDHTEEQRIYEITPEDQLKDCEKFKFEGMLFYSEGQFYRVRGV